MLHKVPRLVLMLVVLAALLQACGSAPATGTVSLPSPTTPADTALPSTPVPSPTPADTQTPRVTPMPTLIATPTPGAVSITAVNGNLAIRTGPADVFDAIDSLKAGKTLPVYARSIEDGWLQVPIPSRPGGLGWVSTTTGFSRVDGYVLDLPLISEVEWPFGAYVVNCTAHQLVAEPGDKALPPVSAAPANRVWFFPGLYKIYDAEVANRPEITQVKLLEHAQVSVISDGSGTKYTCP